MVDKPLPVKGAIRRVTAIHGGTLILGLGLTIAANLLANSLVTSHVSPIGTAHEAGEVSLRSLRVLLSGTTVAFLVLMIAEAPLIHRSLMRDIARLLHEAGRTDPLTGCLNRRAFAEECGRLFARARRFGSGIAVMIVSADRFQELNLRHGRDTGDLAISGLVAALRRNIREMDVLGQLGSQEFAIALPESGLVAALLAAQRIRRAVAAERTHLRGRRSPPVAITISVGVAVLRESDQTLYDALDRAAGALGRAQADGGDRVESEEDATAARETTTS